MARRYHHDDRGDAEEWFVHESDAPARGESAICPHCAEPVLAGGTFCVRCEGYVGPDDPAPNMKPLWNWLCLTLAVGAAAWWAVAG